MSEMVRFLTTELNSKLVRFLTYESESVRFFTYESEPELVRFLTTELKSESESVGFLTIQSKLARCLTPQSRCRIRQGF